MRTTGWEDLRLDIHEEHPWWVMGGWGGMDSTMEGKRVSLYLPPEICETICSLQPFWGPQML
jgi:hypothetical protein